MFRYCLCCFLLVSALVTSAADRVVVVEPGQLQKTYTPGQSPYAFADSRSWKEPVSVQSGTIKVPVTTARKTTWPNFRAGLKNALKINPGQMLLNAAVAGSVAAVGWVMSPENTQLRKKTSDGQIQPATVYGYGVGTSGCPSPQPSIQYWQTCYQAVHDSVDGRFYWKALNLRPAANGAVTYDWQQSWKSTGAIISTSVMTVQKVGNCTAPLVLNSLYQCVDPTKATYTSISDTDYDTLVGGFTDPNVAAGVAPDVIHAVPGSYDYPDNFSFDGPASIDGIPTSTTTTTPSGTTVSETTPHYNFQYSSDPLSITTTTVNTTNVYNNGSLTSTTTTTNGGGVQDVKPPKDPPTDCDLIPTVCTWLAWFKEVPDMPNPDLSPPSNDDMQQTYSASFGGGCPAPQVVATNTGGSISLTWEPICDFAGYLKFLVVGGAALMAAFIGLGISRGNG